MLSDSFLEHFMGLTDPRLDNHNRRHLLTDMLILTILGVICGADSWTEIEAFGHAKYDWLKTFLGLPNGIPSHDTLGRLFARLCPVELQSCFLSWVQSLVKITEGRIVPIDGKTLRRSHDKTNGKAAIHMVSAFASENGLVLGQVKTDEKSNEITAMPQLIEVLDLKGSIVTIDAMGCQKEIAKKIKEKEADYVLSLKGNQSTLHEEVKDFWETALAQNFSHMDYDYGETIDKGHGRIEIRRFWVSQHLETLSKANLWEGLRSIGMVESERHIGNKISTERRFYILSLEANAKLFGQATRLHWGIENQLHWSLDMTFREDECRIRQDNAPQNLAVIRHMVLNMLKSEKTAKVGLKIKRSKAGWDNSYLMKVLEAGGF